MMARRNMASNPEGNAYCKRWTPFCRGWAHRYEWGDFCVLLASDKEEAAKFDIMIAIVAGDTVAPWHHGSRRKLGKAKP